MHNEQELFTVTVTVYYVVLLMKVVSQVSSGHVGRAPLLVGISG